MITVNGIARIKKLEFKHLPSGTAVTEMKLSFKSTYKDGDGKYQYGYVKATCFGKLAELHNKHFKIGDTYHVANGELRTSFFESKGEKKSEQFIILNHLGFVPDSENKSSTNTTTISNANFASDDVAF